MSGSELRDARVGKKWNQADLAGRLAVSQAYVSLLESGQRPVPERLTRKLVSVLGLPASTLPVSTESTPLPADDVARALGSLGYSGFAHLRHARKFNPAELLVRTLRSSNVEARLVEALPWLLVNYPRVDWQWLLREAKVNDLQNRLGFVVSVAREVAEKRGKSDAVEVLRRWESVLENSRLQKEDSFAQDALTETERKWLRNNRSKVAAHWNLLTSMSAETVADAF
jgi:transcriptional regulator with XRE-family HTH domain